MSKEEPRVEEPVRIGAYQAKVELSRLLRQARAGKRFIITKRGRPVAEIGPAAGAGEPKPSGRGDMKGKIWISDDFCDEIEDMREYME